MKKIFAGLVLALLVLGFSGIASVAQPDFGDFMNQGQQHTPKGDNESHTPGITDKVSDMTEKISEKISEKVKHWHSNLGMALHDFLTSPETREEIKQRVKACKENQSEECKQLREIGRYIAKGVLERALNHTIMQLENVKERITNNANLTDEQKQEIIEKIDELIAKLNELKEKLESAETGQAIREIIKEYKGLRHNLNLQLRIRVHAMKQKRVGLVIQRAQHLEQKLEKFLEKCNDTAKQAEIQEMIDEFKAKIDEALSYYEENKAIWEELKNTNWDDMTAEQKRELLKEKIKEASEKLKQAHLALRDAQHILRDIIKELKQCLSEQESETETNETEESNEAETNETEPEVTTPPATEDQTSAQTETA